MESAMNPQPAPLHEAAYPEALAEAEAQLVCTRRDQGQPKDRDARAVVRDAVGVAISGGGIRSATFALGVFQAMAKSKSGFLRSVDFLSTVSGGGYFGGFLTSLFARSRETRDETWSKVREALADGSRTMSYLRENGRFLAPAGRVDLLFAGSVALRNWLALQAAVFSVVLPVVCILRWLRIVWSQGAPQLLQLPLCSLTETALGTPECCSIEDQLWTGILGWSREGSILYLPALSVLLLAALPFGWSYWLVGAPDTGFGVLYRWWKPKRWQTAPRWLPAKASIVPIFAALLVASVFAAESRRTLLAWTILWITCFAFAVQAISRAFSAPYRPRLRSLLAFAWRFLLVMAGYLVACAATIAAARACGVLGGGQSMDFLHACALFGIALLPTALVSAATRYIPPFDLAFAHVDPTQNEGMEGDLHGRYNTSVWLKTTLVIGIGLLLAALLDHATYYACKYLKEHPDFLGDHVWSWSALSGLLTTVVGFLHKSVRTSSPLATRSHFALSISLIAYALALLVFLALMLATVAGIYWFVPESAVLSVGAVSFLVAIVLGASRQILNNSTLLPFYEAQITRTFLGASNPSRSSPSASAEQAAMKRTVSHLVGGDDMTVADYYRPDGAYPRGGPLHLINVTINETVDGRSAVEQNDRKGLGLALGPAGLSAGVRHHVTTDWQHDTCVTPDTGTHYKVFDYPQAEAGKNQFFAAEKLSVGRWLGISGAAFSTGLGYRTNLGLSFLLGLANVRLGYWWSAGSERKPSIKRFFGAFVWVQSYLLKELLARFPGTADALWYLSDGGHFENMGAYELLRRRLRKIVLIDAEADPDFLFEGLGNLVRKARLDLAAEIEFLDAAALGEDAPIWRELAPFLPSLRGRVGELCGLTREKPDAYSRAHAAVARIRYAEDPNQLGLLLYIKPALTGNESADIRQYHTKHPDFPHQTTGDQFFDEAQWESYRKLGMEIGTRLFPPATTSSRRGSSVATSEAEAALKGNNGSGASVPEWHSEGDGHQCPLTHLPPAAHDKLPPELERRREPPPPRRST
jgi:hypothetical protein